MVLKPVEFLAWGVMWALTYYGNHYFAGYINPPAKVQETRGAKEYICLEINKDLDWIPPFTLRIEIKLTKVELVELCNCIDQNNNLKWEKEVGRWGENPSAFVDVDYRAYAQRFRKKMITCAKNEWLSKEFFK